MQVLDLNLASRPFRNNVLLWIVYGLAFGALLLFSGFSVASYIEHKRLLSELNSKVDSIDAQTRDLEQRDARARAGIAKHDLPSLLVQSEKANEVIEGKAFSWTRLFNLLAEIQPYNVRMTSVRPIFRVDGGRPAPVALARPPEGRSVPVSIDAMAKTYGDMLEMQRALIEDPHFGRLEMERLIRAQNGREYLFQLSFLYFPDATRDADPDEAAPGVEQAEEGAADAATVPADGDPAAPNEAPDEAAERTDSGEPAAAGGEGP